MPTGVEPASLACWGVGVTGVGPGPGGSGGTGGCGTIGGCGGAGAGGFGETHPKLARSKAASRKMAKGFESIPFKRRRLFISIPKRQGKRRGINLNFLFLRE